MGLLFSGKTEAQPVQQTNLPTFYLTTNNNAPINSKEIYTPGTITIKSSDATEELDMIMEIRGRGNSTWGMAKKPYRIKLDKKTNLLNLPAEEKSWVLLPNYADKTLIRNSVAFKISELVGLEFTPSARFVDVVLNGEYLGNYMVSDQIEVAPGRVEVEKQKKEDLELPRISGGYLLEIDGFADSEPVKFTTKKGLKIAVKYPKDDEINTQQKEYITNFTQQFENRLFASNFRDPVAGYRSLVDTTSLINWYIACELTGNSDSFWSTFIYKRRDIDKLFFGPLWDYDIAFNNDDRLGNAVKKLMRSNAHDPRTWIEQIWKDDWFKAAVNRRWKELVADHLLDSLLLHVDQTVELIDQSQTKNFQKWNILNRKVYREQYLFKTYQEGVDFLKTYLRDRVDYLTASFASTQPPDPISPTGIKDPASAPALLSIFPNPASGTAYLCAIPHSTEPVTVYLHNVSGRCVYSSIKPVSNGSSIIEIPLTENKICSGLYLVTLRTASGEQRKGKLTVK